MYDIMFTKQAQKDAVNVERAGLRSKAEEIIKTVQNNPYEQSQDFEALKYDLKGAYSRHITLHTDLCMKYWRIQRGQKTLRENYTTAL